MGLRWGGTAGATGAGLTLGPPTNTFMGADEAAAQAARDAYAMANADWLVAYDVDSTLLIRLEYSATVAYELRIGGVWLDNTHVVAGPPGDAWVPLGTSAKNELRWNETSSQWEAVSLEQTIYSVTTRANTFAALKAPERVCLFPMRGGYSQSDLTTSFAAHLRRSFARLQ